MTANELLILLYKCPFCLGGLTADGAGGTEPCHHCSGVGLTDDPCGNAERAPRPPAVMRTPAPTAPTGPDHPSWRPTTPSSPTTNRSSATKACPSPHAAPTPRRHLPRPPLGLMVCAGWWALKTGEQLPPSPTANSPSPRTTSNAAGAPPLRPPRPRRHPD
ncbi:hypothetical protein O1L44_29970 [Streptomyces noursei]|nr:hypothetical protein [Streptomyces noursei]